MSKTDPSKTREALVALSRLLAPGDDEVERQVLLAHDDPEGYVKAFATSLEERSIDAPEPNLAFIALSDALHERERAFVVDHRSFPEEIIDGLEVVLPALGLDAATLLGWYDEEEWDVSAEVFLKACGRALAAHGHALVDLDIGSDGWEPTVIPFDAVADAVAHGKALGMGRYGRVTSLSPSKRPAKLPKPAKPSPASVHDTFELPAGEGPEHPHGHAEGTLLWATDPPGRHVLGVDISTWPPTLHELLQDERPPFLLATSPSGARVVCTASYDAEAANKAPRGEGVTVSQMLLLRSGAAPRDLLPALPPGVQPERVCLFGDAVVLLPTEGSFRGSPFDRPLVWDGGESFQEIEELPRTKVIVFMRNELPAFVRHGFARTGAGVDVLLWEGRGWVREDGLFVARYDLGTGRPGEPMPTTPGPGDAFFVLIKGGLREVRPEAPPVEHLPRFPALHDLAPGPSGTLIATQARYRKSDPIAVVYDPGTRAHFDVPPHVLGIEDDDSPGVLRYAPATNRLLALYDNEVRSVPYAAVEAARRS